VFVEYNQFVMMIALYHKLFLELLDRQY